MANNCSKCKYYEGGYCHRYPELIEKNDSGHCGEFEKEPYTMIPLTKEQLAAKKAEDTRPLSDKELREQAESRRVIDE